MAGPASLSSPAADDLVEWERQQSLRPVATHDVLHDADDGEEPDISKVVAAVLRRRRSKHVKKDSNVDASLTASDESSVVSNTKPTTNLPASRDVNSQSSFKQLSKAQRRRLLWELKQALDDANKRTRKANGDEGSAAFGDASTFQVSLLSGITADTNLTEGTAGTGIDTNATGITAGPNSASQYTKSTDAYTRFQDEDTTFNDTASLSTLDSLNTSEYSEIRKLLRQRGESLDDFDIDQHIENMGLGMCTLESGLDACCPWLMCANTIPEDDDDDDCDDEGEEQHTRKFRMQTQHQIQQDNNNRNHKWMAKNSNKQSNKNIIMEHNDISHGEVHTEELVLDEDELAVTHIANVYDGDLMLCGHPEDDDESLIDWNGNGKHTATTKYSQDAAALKRTTSVISHEGQDKKNISSGGSSHSSGSNQAKKPLSVPMTVKQRLTKAMKIRNADENRREKSHSQSIEEAEGNDMGTKTADDAIAKKRLLKDYYEEAHIPSPENIIEVPLPADEEKSSSSDTSTPERETEQIRQVDQDGAESSEVSIRTEFVNGDDIFATEDQSGPPYDTPPSTTSKASMPPLPSPRRVPLMPSTAAFVMSTSMSAKQRLARAVMFKGKGDDVEKGDIMTSDDEGCLMESDTGEDEAGVGTDVVTSRDQLLSKDLNTSTPLPSGTSSKSSDAAFDSSTSMSVKQRLAQAMKFKGKGDAVGKRGFTAGDDEECRTECDADVEEEGVEASDFAFAIQKELDEETQYVLSVKDHLTLEAVSPSPTLPSSTSSPTSAAEFSPSSWIVPKQRIAQAIKFNGKGDAVAKRGFTAGDKEFLTESEASVEEEGVETSDIAIATENELDEETKDYLTLEAVSPSTTLSNSTSPTSAAEFSPSTWTFPKQRIAQAVKFKGKGHGVVKRGFTLDDEEFHEESEASVEEEGVETSDIAIATENELDEETQDVMTVNDQLTLETARPPTTLSSSTSPTSAAEFPPSTWTVPKQRIAQAMKFKGKGHGVGKRGFTVDDEEFHAESEASVEEEGVETSDIPLSTENELDEETQDVLSVKDQLTLKAWIPSTPLSGRAFSPSLDAEVSPSAVMSAKQRLAYAMKFKGRDDEVGNGDITTRDREGYQLEGDAHVEEEGVETSDVAIATDDTVEEKENASFSSRDLFALKDAIPFTRLSRSASPASLEALSQNAVKHRFAGVLKRSDGRKTVEDCGAEVNAEEDEFEGTSVPGAVVNALVGVEAASSEVVDSFQTTESSPVSTTSMAKSTGEVIDVSTLLSSTSHPSPKAVTHKLTCLLRRGRNSKKSNETGKVEYYREDVKVNEEEFECTVAPAPESGVRQFQTGESTSPSTVEPEGKTTGWTNSTSTLQRLTQVMSFRRQGSGGVEKRRGEADSFEHGRMDANMAEEEHSDNLARSARTETGDQKTTEIAMATKKSAVDPMLVCDVSSSIHSVESTEKIVATSSDVESTPPASKFAVMPMLAEAISFFTENDANGQKSHDQSHTNSKSQIEGRMAAKTLHEDISCIGGETLYHPYTSVVKPTPNDGLFTDDSNQNVPTASTKEQNDISCDALTTHADVSNRNASSIVTPFDIIREMSIATHKANNKTTPFLVNFTEKEEDSPDSIEFTHEMIIATQKKNKPSSKLADIRLRSRSMFTKAKSFTKEKSPTVSANSISLPGITEKVNNSTSKKSNSASAIKNSSKNKKPKRWREYTDPSSGKTYYSNGITSTWTKPPSSVDTNALIGRAETTPAKDVPFTTNTPQSVHSNKGNISSYLPPDDRNSSNKKKSVMLVKEAPTKDHELKHAESKSSKFSMILKCHAPNAKKSPIEESSICTDNITTDSEGNVSVVMFPMNSATSDKIPASSDCQEVLQNEVVSHVRTFPICTDVMATSCEQKPSPAANAFVMEPTENAYEFETKEKTTKPKKKRKKRKGWREYTDPNTGNKYYSNGIITTWDKPAEFNADSLTEVPGMTTASSQVKTEGDKRVTIISFS